MLNGSEVNVYTDDDNIKQELAKGQKDRVWLIHEILSKKMLSEKHEEIGEAEVDLSSVPQTAGMPVVSAQVYTPGQY